MTLAFFDTNILVYAYAQADPRAECARALLHDGGRISVQSLNEFVNVVRRKLGWDWAKVDDALAELHEVFDRIVVLDGVLHRTGIGLAKRYRLSIYDSMIVAAAIIAECDRVYSEDMQHGLIVADRVTIENPFRSLQDRTAPV